MLSFAILPNHSALKPATKTVAVSTVCNQAVSWPDATGICASKIGIASASWSSPCFQVG